MKDFNTNLTENPATRFILHHRLVQHILFWLTFFIFVPIMLLQRNPADFTNNMVRDMIHFGLTMITVYYNLLYLFPRYFYRGKYVKYLLILSGTILLVAVGGVFISGYISASLPQVDVHEFTPGPSMIFMSYIFPQVFFISITMLLHFIKEWASVQEMELRYKRAEQERLRSQIDSLKAQINPHFLFNTLNNIYSHSLYNDPATPRLILELSDLMSYIIYDCDDETVSLTQEMDFITKYIALEKMRIDDNVAIDIDVESGMDRFSIAPLLFLPLIENVFKHARQVTPPKNYLTLKMYSDQDDQLHVRIENFIEDDISDTERNGGIGMQNVQRRLELIYPHRHIFTAEAVDGRFIISLIIKPDRN